VYPYLDHDGPIAMAHRGGAKHPDNLGYENSLRAFQHAVDLGYRYLETDLHATSDGVVVAFHDHRLDRVTDRTGAIAELPWSEVQKARINGHEPIPRLDELLEQFPDVPAEWKNEAVAEKWAKIRKVRSVVTGALEIERKDKRIGSSLEAAPVVYVSDADLMAALEGQDFEETCITSDITITAGEGPEGAFRLAEVPGVAVEPKLAEGTKCARSWRVTKDVGSDPDYPDVSVRDAAALRELKSLGRLG